ncbi:MAG: serine hydrolase [Lachnospiraceae bacterium]|nr:serine hydrolase [Lachnospiraceae bacterium]
MKNSRPHNNTQENVNDKIASTGYPNLSRANNTKIIVVGSLAAILLIFILSILFPSDNTNDSSTSETETTTEATTEKPIDTGWQEIDGAIRYVRNDGKIAKSQWVDGHYVGATGVMYVSTLTPDGMYVDINGDIDESVGTAGSRKGLWDLDRTLEDMVSGYTGTWSVYVKDIAGHEYLSINNVQHFSASLIKLYCAATAYELMENGDLEETPQIDSLMRQMISVSDNDAFNLMVMNCGETYSHIAGRAVIQDYIDREGYKDTTITSILVPTKYKAPSSPGRNYTTVEDCGLLLERIYKKQCVSADASDAFLQLLLNQEHRGKIPAGLPEGTKCANKTGDTNESQHDAAIVYSPGGDYIIVVMSSNCGAAITNIQNISRTVYDYFN